MTDDNVINRVPGTDRLAEIRRLTAEMEQANELSEGHFNAVGMLLTDASLAGDGPALVAAQDGLQWLYSRHARFPEPVADIEQRGRLLGLIDVTHWALRRLPEALQLSFDPTSHATRFLCTVAARPGLSNSELAGLLDIDETEVSRVGRRLLAAGVVWRRKEWRRNAWAITPRGRQYLDATGMLPKASRVRFVVGIKLRPTRFVGVVTDPGLLVLDEPRELHLSGPLDADEVADEIASFVRDLLASTPETADCRPDEVAVGVEIGGHVSARDGQVVYAPNYAPHGDWTGLPLASQLEAILGMSTVIENDANALAVFEQVYGDNAGLRSSAVIVLDEGIGSGIIANDRLLHGSGGSAGEIGHLVVEPNGPECRCHHKGCLESLAGTLAIIDRLNKGSDEKVKDLAGVAQLVAQGNQAARKVVLTAGEALGRGLSDLLNLVNPSRVILYAPPELIDESQYASAGCFLAAAHAVSKSYTFSDAGAKYDLIPKPFEYSAGARAAAGVALLRHTGSVDNANVEHVELG